MSTAQTNNKETHTNELLSNFHQLHEILSKNSYIRDTTNKLQRIIEDASSNIQIILVGKERVGKSSIINALLGRKLFPVEHNIPTEVNTFIKYGEQERIEVVFYDGFVVTFTLDKLYLIVNSKIEAAEIIREHISYIRVFIKNDLLKQITLIDTHAFEVVNNQSVYFSETLLNRVDEIFWIIRANSPATDDEIQFMRRVSARHMKPHVIVNAIDELGTGANDFIQKENQKYGQYAEKFIPFSSKLAIEAREFNDTQKLIDSKITPFMEEIKRLAGDNERKQSHVHIQLSNWLVRLRKEMELISSREPYLSAIELMKQREADKQREFSKEQRDQAIIKTYEEDYKSSAQIFKNVQTLYQLLQVIGNHFFLRDATTEIFEEMATNYLQVLRSYRNTLSEYEIQYKNLDKFVKTAEQMNDIKVLTLSSKANRTQAQDSIVLLNEKQTILLNLHETIVYFEQQLTEQLDVLLLHLNNITKNQLKRIMKQVAALNEQRQLEFQSIEASIQKLGEFDCLLDAQNFISTSLRQSIDGIEDQIDETVKIELFQTINFIQAIELEHRALNDITIDEVDHNLTKPIYVSFEHDYPFMPLTLTEEDIISKVEPVPTSLTLAN